MNESTEQESDVSWEIETLRAILRSGALAAPALGFIKAALALLESEGECPQTMGLTGEAAGQKDRPAKEPDRSKSLGSIDSLGGGNII